MARVPPAMANDHVSRWAPAESWRSSLTGSPSTTSSASASAVIDCVDSPIQMDHGILAYAAYLPRHRLPHEQLEAQLGTRGGAGQRILASFDEDSTTMAVEAARRIAGPDSPPGSIYFATTTPPYLDKTNASAIHSALDLGHDGFAVDMAGSARSSVGALRAA